MSRKHIAAAVSGLIVTASLLASAPSASAGTAPTFSNTPLIAHWSLPPGYTTTPIPNSTGNSEPAIAFGADGTMAVDGLAWLPYQVNLWKGRFGDTPPSYFGAMDTNLPIRGQGRTNLGDGDADVDITSAGTIVLADLDIIVNHAFNNAQLGVSVTRCPADATGPADCTTSILDTAGADRPWITHYGTTVYVSYHDAGNSTQIHVQKSTDDGRTWRRVGSPILGQGDVTGNSTYNNSLGPIVADPTTGYVYEAFMAGEQQTKCCSADFNNVYVARSTDGGKHWHSTLVYHTAPFTRLNNFWPALAIDPSNGQLWTAWTDLHGVSISTSTDHGLSWSSPRTVSNIRTTVMPWVAASNGKVDVVYYGSPAVSTDVESAVWNAYDSQLKNGSWSVGTISNTPVRVGRICLEGSACEGDRQLLDLFEVAEDPITGKAAVIYTSSEINNYISPTSGGLRELPEIVLAYEQ